MASEQRIALQSFTRVHLVPRVNGTAAAALVFERKTEEPLAMSLPLEVMGQVFGVLPKVMAQSAAPAVPALPAVQADASAPAAPLPSVQWVLDGFELLGEGPDTRLLLRVDGVALQLQMDAALMGALAERLGQAVGQATAQAAAGQALAKPKVATKPKTAAKPKAVKADKASAGAADQSVGGTKKKKAGKA